MFSLLPSNFFKEEWFKHSTLHLLCIQRISVFYRMTKLTHFNDNNNTTNTLWVNKNTPLYIRALLGVRWPIFKSTRNDTYRE